MGERYLGLFSKFSVLAGVVRISDLDKRILCGREGVGATFIVTHLTGLPPHLQNISIGKIPGFFFDGEKGGRSDRTLTYF